ncbi:MFS transporter [Lentisphaerota bacterium ZTH]|nr:MFS transporter [Lentisphaerota bacterium]WET07446.1 MFS transporter [Lentisphaerota bacterium ZTH]
MFTWKDFKVVLLSCLGGSLEFFDFTVYALFAPYISKVFFPVKDTFTGLLAAFGVFALGYFARPLGGIIFGYLGDYYGRCIAFSSCVLIMAVSTLFIGLLPGYEQIGILAPVLLTLLRIAQGISVGGEIPGSSIFSAEHLFDKNRGLVTGAIFMFITLGNVFGSVLGYFLKYNFSTEDMLHWGWRIPFIAGFFLGIVSFFLRKRVYETAIYKDLKTFDKISRFPLVKVIREEPALLFTGFGLTALSACTISLILYLPTYLISILGFEAESSYLVTTTSFLILAVCSMIFGYVSDKAGRKIVLISGSVLSVFSGFAGFYMLIHAGHAWVYAFSILIAVTVGMVNGAYGISIIELFPANVRASGMGLSFNMGLAIIGGLSPFLFTFLIKETGSPMAPYLLFLVCAVITGISGWHWKSSFNRLDKATVSHQVSK